jgi:dihydroflavonol-4-reductase
METQMHDTILLTGVSGFLAKHVALRFLDAGHAVRGTLRRLDRAEEVRAAIAPHLRDRAALDRLVFVQADLTADAGWAAALAGVSAVVHTASPFPIVQPQDADVLLRPAVEGTRRVLAAAAAAGVRRAVVTSSSVAIEDPGRQRMQTEDDWADEGAANAYARSKTLAERAAWEVAGQTGIALTVVNPTLILGPPLDGAFGSSIGLVRRILAGKDPMLPDLGFSVVDVRDVAEAHLRALTRPGTEGRRFIASAGPMSMVEMGRLLKAAYPDRRIPTRLAPRLVLRLLALFDRELQAALPLLGRMPQLSNARAVADLGMSFTPPAEALRATADWLIANRAV